MSHYPEGGAGTDDWVDMRKIPDGYWVRLPSGWSPAIVDYGFALDLEIGLGRVMGPWPKTSNSDDFLSQLTEPNKIYLRSQSNPDRSKALQ